VFGQEKPISTTVSMQFYLFVLIQSASGMPKTSACPGYCHTLNGATLSSKVDSNK